MSLTEARKELNLIWDNFNYDFSNYQNYKSHNATQRLSMTEAESLLKGIGQIEITHTGKKSKLSGAKKYFGLLKQNEADVKQFGQEFQELDRQIRLAIFSAQAHLQAQIQSLKTISESLDVTLPGRRGRQGHLHPITLLRQRIEDIFVTMGFVVEDDREIETDYYNFDALNIPEGHPARASQDTFYTTEGLALRSQTSTVQIRAMERRGAPIRMIAPGRVFRRDTPDATHNPMFFQVEGLCVDRGISMAHLKGTMGEFLQRLFGPQTKTRFRPSYFPFTEPSAEFDFSCFKCGGAGCNVCKQSGWIELGGCGMVHPNVLKGVGIDPEEFTGFAFGLGIDRMCALMYGLDDIRLLFENDVRFLSQFS